jgi:hypothetical protein
MYNRLFSVATVRPGIQKRRRILIDLLSLLDTGQTGHMPTVLRAGPYRFFFYAGDRDEPLHIHVERDDHTAKFWLDQVRLRK